MTGQVVSLRAAMPLTFRLPGKPDLQIEFVIDTGFSGALTLPAAAIAAMGLPFLEDIQASLANDQSLAVPVYAGTILWHGAERVVRILAIGRRPLLGTALLNGNHLGVLFEEGGAVTITLPSPP